MIQAAWFRMTGACALLIGVAATHALAQTPAPKKEMEAFDRQLLKAKPEIDPTGKVVIDVEAERAVYPNGAMLVLTLQYIQGETNEQQPYGNPEETKKDGTTKRISSTQVLVRDWRYQARFTFDKYLPPGEYAISGFFQMSQQSRKVLKEYVNEYVPAHERKNPCEFCRYHYGMTKVAVTDPNYKFSNNKWLEVKDKPLWWRQKQDYRERVMLSYKDWYAQIIGARESLGSVFYQVLRFGPQEMMGVDKEVALLPGPSQNEQNAILSWGAIQRGLEGCQQYLSQNRGLPSDPNLYWRLRAYGDGHPPEENLSNPVPDAGTADRPWSDNYVMPRIALILDEMQQHHREVAVLMSPQTFMDLRNLCDRVKAMLIHSNGQVDAAIETILVKKLLEELKSAPEDRKNDLSQNLVRSYYDNFLAKEIEKINALKEMARDMARLETQLAIAIKFPIVTWPLPASIMEKPQNSDDFNREQISRRFGGLLEEARKKSPDK